MDAGNYRPIEDVLGGVWTAHPLDRAGLKDCLIFGRDAAGCAGAAVDRVTVPDADGGRIAFARVFVKCPRLSGAGPGQFEAHASGPFYRVGTSGALTPW